MGQREMSETPNQSVSSVTSRSAPGGGTFGGWDWLVLLPAVGLAASAVPIAWIAGKASVPDAVFAVALGGLFLAQVFTRRRAGIPVSMVVVVALYGLSAVVRGANADAFAEVAQRYLQLFAGGTALMWLAARRPAWLLASASAAAAVSSVAGLAQMAGGMPAAEICGFLPSRIAFCAFQGGLLLWCFPQWVGMSCRPKVRLVVFGAALALLLPVTHAQIAVLVALVLLIASAWSDRQVFQAALVTLVGVLVLWAALPGRAGRFQAFAESAKIVENGRVRQAHAETIAALRMAVSNPLVGVGPGNYQREIGRYYGTLPNPNEQSIESGHQSGWGILAASGGLPAASVFLVAILSGSVVVLRRLRAPRNAYERQVLGAAFLGVGIFVLGWITDPLVRGTGWLVALALAGVCTPRSGQGVETTWRGTLVASVLGAFPVALVVVQLVAGGSGGEASGGEEQLVTFTWEAGYEEGADRSLADDPAVVAILPAEHAEEVTAPMTFQQAVDGRRVLRIREGAGKPPPDREPDLDDGAARFSLPDGLEAGRAYTVWLRVRWDDGCGNSVYVSLPNRPLVVAGNDGLYGRWHWVKVPGTLDMASGLTEMGVLNREDGVAISDLLFATAPTYVPQGAP